MKYKYIDLHLHLDGAITPKIAKKLIKLQNLKYTKNRFKLKKLIVAPKNCKNLNDFLKCFELPGDLLQTKEAIKTAVILLLKNLKKQNVIYSEIRFAPQKHTLKGLSQEQVVLAALEGLKEANKNEEIKSNLILCLMRGENNEKENFETVELAKKYLVKENGVTAIDLAGAEGLYKTEKFEKFFKKANEYNIPFTIHAGEADNYKSVLTAVNFKSVRIGHGIKAAENEETLKILKEKNICLEICPTSNIITNAFNKEKGYPFKLLYNYGIKLTVNTDDPAIENTDIAKEFKYLKKNFNLTKKDIHGLLNNAIDFAFTGKEQKEKLKYIFKEF